MDDGFPDELQDMLNNHTVTKCRTLLVLRRVNRKKRELIDNNIEKLYDMFSVNNPDLSPIDFSVKTKFEKRQAVFSACLDEERKRILRKSMIFQPSK